MSFIDHRPLSVVSSDQQALSIAMQLHAVQEPRILDVTYNQGRIWKRTPFLPHKMDLNPDLKERGITDTVADFRAMPFENGSFDVIVFDPPHVCNAGENSIVGGSGTDWGERFGNDSPDIHGVNEISAWFIPFLLEAQRVLVPKTGIVLAKIADQVTSGEYHFQHNDFIEAVKTVGMKACDLLLKVSWSRGGLNDPKWLHVFHARQVHCYWIVVRNGTQCMNPNGALLDKPYSLSMFDTM